MRAAMSQPDLPVKPWRVEVDPQTSVARCQVCRGRAGWLITRHEGVPGSLIHEVRSITALACVHHLAHLCERLRVDGTSLVLTALRLEPVVT